MLHARPASCKVKAAFSPAIPAPMIAMRVCLSIFLLYNSQGLFILLCVQQKFVRYKSGHESSRSHRSSASFIHTGALSFRVDAPPAESPPRFPISLDLVPRLDW